MKILSIETSCDETAIAVIETNLQINSGKLLPLTLLADVVSSQVNIHAAWGGVVPNLAAREHVKNIIPVIDEALQKAKTRLAEIDLFATTQGPGLIPALLIGTNVAKTLAYRYRKPLIGIHHVEGHIYANFIEIPQTSGNSIFPMLCLIVSGGHTQLIMIRNHHQYEIIGQTLDDAAGEAFDKIAKILGLGYPGGPIVSQMAKIATEQKPMLPQEDQDLIKKISFPRPLLNKPTYNFSFSGLKTAVLYAYRDLTHSLTLPDSPYRSLPLDFWKHFICLEAENAIVEVLTKKTLKAMETFSPRTVMMAGGVAANNALRSSIQSAINQYNNDHNNSINFINPPIQYCGDNGAMIAAAAAYRYANLYQGQPDETLMNNWKNLEPNANLKL
jgi:N6-L-threonylcarbamoyladenine synthase